MNKWYIIGIIYIVVASIACILIYNSLKPKTLGQIYKDGYELFDYNIGIIEDNMNDITITIEEEKWVRLKDLNLDDEKLKATYNLIVDDIKTCYLMSTDLENKIFDNPKILSFRDKTNYTYDDIKKLNQNKNCLENFDKYNSLNISENPELENRIRAQIKIIINNQSKKADLKEFKDALYYELNIINKIASLSNWLKVEYDTYRE